MSSYSSGSSSSGYSSTNTAGTTSSNQNVSKSDYVDMPKPTEEPTNRDENNNVRPGGVDLRTPINKEKDRESTNANLKYLDENVNDRNRYSASNPHLGEPYSSLQTLAMQSLRRYGDMHPGTVDGEVIMMFVEFANLVLEDLRSHPYFDNIEVDYYTHPTEHRNIPDQIMVAGLLYNYAVQQQSNKVEAYGPMYFRTMNRILYNRKYGNSKIEISPHDRGSDNLCSNRAYDAGRK
tara:strand:+ start:14187 stop:14891 length:705 start_codon:yes stop_codon:yes gene_type:complete